MSAALSVFDAGLLAIPCGGADGKRPLVKFSGVAAPTERAKLRALIRRVRFQEARTGVVTGRGRYPITVVDIDQAALLGDVVRALCPTPIVVRTPSGGAHL